MRFSKYHGCGNDFIIVDETKGQRTPDDERGRLAKLLCDRHFGVGADGLIFIEPADGTDGAMRHFEPAGNEADMCGNGLRCVALHLSDNIAADKESLTIMTRDGVKNVARKGEGFEVDMGEVRFARKHLSQYVSDSGDPEDSMLEFPLKCCGTVRKGSILNTGEPHIVLFEDDISAVDVVSAGAEVNSDRDRFPKTVNLNFVQIDGPGAISIRTYERWVFDETLACGTGATAAAAVAILKGMVTERSVAVTTRGGTLTIRLGDDHRAYLAGPAVRVFSGTLDLKR